MEKSSRGSPGWPPSQAATASTPLHLRLTLPVGGLDRDGHGAYSVEQALTGVPGVARAYANAEMEMVYVEFDSSRTGIDELRDAIESVGCRIAPEGEPQ